MLPSLAMQPLRLMLGGGLQALSLQRLLKNFEPKVSFLFEKGHFRIKTAADGVELEQALRLRYDVFHREFMNKKLPFGMDVDRFDQHCDHLIIQDKRTGVVVGTYRFLCSKFTDDFYSATELNIADFLKAPGVKLEMSRACIRRSYRSGSVMHLLWRGLVAYVQQIGAQYLFGLASVKTMDFEEAALVYQSLQGMNAISQRFMIWPTGDFIIPDFDKTLAKLHTQGKTLSDENAKQLIPPLFSSYLKAGAKVYGTPAFDREFRCVDYFTILDMNDLNDAFERKYVTAEPV